MPRRDSGKASKIPDDSGRPKASESRAAAFHSAGGTGALLAAKTFLEKSLGLDGTESWPVDAFDRARAREVACLESWASEKNLWLPPEKFRKRRRGGQEHDIVIVGNPVRRVIKLTKGGFFGVYPRFDESLVSGNLSDRFHLQPGTPHQYLSRLLFQNQLAPSVDTLDGFAKIDDRFVIVTSQPFFNGDAAEERAIRAFFSRARFSPVCNGAWYRQSDNVAVFDAVSSNVLDCGGQLVPFDVIPLHPHAALRAGILAAVRANQL